MMLATKTEEATTKVAKPFSGVVKVVEIVGVSDKSFQDAIDHGVAHAAQTLRHISGADVRHMTGVVKDGKIVEYHVDLKLAFAIEEGEDDD